jgi:hypothetical protein
MTSKDVLTVTDRRPAAVQATIAVLVFLGVTAVGGGAAMLLDIGAPPADWLNGIPLIDSWLIPGLVLAIGFGLGSLLAAYGVLARPGRNRQGPVERLTGEHWSWLVTILIGLGQLVWIAVELVYLPEPSALQAVYGLVGLVLLWLPMHPDVRSYLAATGPGR